MVGCIEFDSWSISHVYNTSCAVSTSVCLHQLNGQCELMPENNWQYDCFSHPDWARIRVCSCDGVIDKHRTDGHNVTPAAHTVCPQLVNRKCHWVQCSSVPHSRRRKSTCSGSEVSKGNHKTGPEVLCSFRQLPKIECGRVFTLFFFFCLTGLKTSYWPPGLQ